MDERQNAEPLAYPSGANCCGEQEAGWDAEHCKQLGEPWKWPLHAHGSHLGDCGKGVDSGLSSVEPLIADLPQARLPTGTQHSRQSPLQTPSTGI